METTVLTQGQATEKARRHAANKQLCELTVNRYFDGLPIAQIQNIMEANGFDVEELDRFYVGQSDRAVMQVGEKTWLAISWYRLESGRYEVIAYLS